MYTKPAQPRLGGGCQFCRQGDPPHNSSGPGHQATAKRAESGCPSPQVFAATCFNELCQAIAGHAVCHNSASRMPLQPTPDCSLHQRLDNIYGDPHKAYGITTLPFQLTAPFLYTTNQHRASGWASHKLSPNLAAHLQDDSCHQCNKPVAVDGSAITINNS